MGEDISVAQEVKQGNRAFGIGLGISPTRDNKISFLTLVVEFRVKETGEVLGNGLVDVSDGSIGNAMKAVFNDAKAKAMPTIYEPAHQTAYDAAYDAAIDEEKSEAEAVSAGEGAGRNAGNLALIDAGIVLPNAQAIWKIAQNKVDQAIADKSDDAPESLADIAAALVKILKNAGTAAIPWGEFMLRQAFRKQVMQVQD